MAGFLLLTAPRGVRAEHEAFFNAVQRYLARLVDDFHTESIEGRDYRAAKLWLSHSRTAGFGKDEATGSWLAVVGNPTHGDIQTVSPAELPGRLLRRYFAEGQGALTELNAPFVIVLYDGRDGSFHVVADRGGFQHLYHAEYRGAHVLCTSSLALAAHMTVHLDLEGVACYFQVGHLYGQGTLFQEIRKTDAATWLTLEDGSLRTQRYWVPPGPSDTRRSGEDWGRELAECAQEEMATVLTAGVPTTVELTGGRDSRLNLACALATGKPFVAWTMAAPAAADLRVIEALREARAFTHRATSPLADLEERFFADLSEAHRLGDGEGNCLNLIASPGCNRQAAAYRAQSVSGLGGEMFRGFYYASHIGKRTFDLNRLLSLQLVANTGFRAEMFTVKLREGARDVLASKASSYFIETDGMPLLWRLDKFYLAGRMQRFAGRTISGGHYRFRVGLPLFSNKVLEMSFRVPSHLKRAARVVRHAMEIVDPLLANVSLATGEPAGKPALIDARQRIARGRHLLRRGRQTMAWWFLRVPVPIRDEQGIDEVVVRQLTSREGQGLLEPERMASGCLYDRDELGRFLQRNREDGFRDRFQIGLMLSMELTMRHVGSTVCVPSSLGIA